MGYSVNLISDKKGGNPGGLVEIDYHGHERHAYLKYVFGGKKLEKTPFIFTNQPIYEAITYELARYIGLKTPEYFVLQQSQSSPINFNYGFLPRTWNNHFPYYFVSVYAQEGVDILIGDKSSGAAIEEIVKDKLARELILLADIEGRGQNYLYDDYSGRIIYHDLGCSFLHAAEGFLRISGASKPIDFEMDSSPIHRRELRFLEDCYFTDPEGKEINLLSLVHYLGELKIHMVNPESNRSITSLVSQEEIEGIQNFYFKKINALARKFMGKGIYKN
jgi:hypothetical protein